jgi:hypothetical protein
MSEVLAALQVVSTTAKLQDVPSHRLIVLGAVDSFQPALAGFSIRLDKHEVPFKGLWVSILDQKRHFYGGDARFFGRLSNGDLFLPQQVLNPFPVLDGGISMCLLGLSKYFHTCTCAL